MSRGLLITGATGKQGGATLNALVESQDPNFTILAVTRSPDSPSAQKLKSKASNIKLVQGDLNDIPALFKNAKAVHSDIWGVFSVQLSMGKGASPEIEQVQGKALIDGALANGVQHFVYTSVDRHGADSINNPTDVPHFASKHNIEKYLIEKTKGSNMAWTILRPVAFMDGLTPDFMGKIFGAAWSSALGTSRSLQLVSTRDIGHFAAQAFRKPESWTNRSISLAGDEVTLDQLDQAFKEKTGKTYPKTFNILGSALLWGVAEMGLMMKWFATTGYAADIPSLKKQHPGLLSLGDWIEKESAFAKK